MESKKDLWLRLRNYHFDDLVPPHLADHVRSVFGGTDASTRAFADKIARKLQWNVPFTLRAIDEYKKFVYLGMISDFPVTPPKVIDCVWHEHLLFTRGYRAFCNDVLRREFDHHPELVPQEEQTATFQSQYAATLALYNTEFNRAPAGDFWGTPKFASAPEPVAVAQKPGRRRDDGSASDTFGDAPLYTYFGDSSGGGAHGGATMPEFGGGTSGGGGGGGAFPDSTSHGGHSGSGGHDGGGHGSSDGGGSGGDGGGDGGGSGCSSGCGGGGCSGS